jgi:hypothetical protein
MKNLLQKSDATKWILIQQYHQIISIKTETNSFIFYFFIGEADDMPKGWRG